MGDRTLSAISETSADEKINTEELTPQWGFEVIFCNENVDWVIYFSHEGSVTFAGKKILDALKGEWTQWEKYKDHIIGSG